MALTYSTDGTTWTAYTAGTTVLPPGPVIYFRDAVLAIDTGAATMGPIFLHKPAYQILGQVVAADDTLTAGTGVFHAIVPGVTYGTGREPTPADDDTSGQSWSIADSANEFGALVGGCPIRFEIAYTGITGDAATLDSVAEVHFVY